MSRLTRVTNPDTTHTDFAYDNRGPADFRDRR
jgi:YD repeat-containing protein